MVGLVFLAGILGVPLVLADELSTKAHKTIGHRLLEAEYQVIKATKAAPPVAELDRRRALLDSIVKESAERIQSQALDHTTREDTLAHFQEIGRVLEERRFRLHIPTKLLWNALTIRHASKDAAPHYQYDCDTGSFIYLSVFETLGYPVTLVETPNHFFVRWRLSDTQHIN